MDLRLNQMVSIPSTKSIGYNSISDIKEYMDRKGFDVLYFKGKISESGNTIYRLGIKDGDDSCTIFHFLKSDLVNNKKGW